LVGREGLIHISRRTPRLVLSLTIERRQDFPTLKIESERLGSDHGFSKLQNAGASVPLFPGVTWRLAALVDKWLLKWPDRGKLVGEGGVDVQMNDVEPSKMSGIDKRKSWYLAAKCMGFKPQYRSRQGSPISWVFQGLNEPFRLLEIVFVLLSSNLFRVAPPLVFSSRFPTW
jgi:hypothetical protein